MVLRCKVAVSLAAVDLHRQGSPRRGFHEQGARCGRTALGAARPNRFRRLAENPGVGPLCRASRRRGYALRCQASSRKQMRPRGGPGDASARPERPAWPAGTSRGTRSCRPAGTRRAAGSAGPPGRQGLQAPRATRATQGDIGPRAGHRRSARVTSPRHGIRGGSIAATGARTVWRRLAFSSAWQRDRLLRQRLPMLLRAFMDGTRLSVTSATTRNSVVSINDARGASSRPEPASTTSISRRRRYRPRTALERVEPILDALRQDLAPTGGRAEGDGRNRRRPALRESRTRRRWDGSIRRPDHADEIIVDGLYDQDGSSLAGTTLTCAP